MSGNLQVYEVRKGVFALGTKGRKARAMATWSKKHNGYIGIRGVKPTITDEAKRAAASKTLREKLAELAN